MSKIRINDLARELEVKSKEILDVLTTVGVTEKKTHSSSLEDHEAELVRKHLRGRSEGAPSSAKTSRAAHGDEGIKTKIDLSNISRPGDVLRAITQQKGAAERPAARPVVKPAVEKPAVEAKAPSGGAPGGLGGSVAPSPDRGVNPYAVRPPHHPPRPHRLVLRVRYRLLVPFRRGLRLLQRRPEALRQRRSLREMSCRWAPRQRSRRLRLRRRE